MELFLGAFEREWEQRRAALTHDRDLANSKRQQMEEEARHRLRMAKGGGSGNGLGKMGRGGGASSPWPAGSAALARPMATRLEAVASGSQPAVVKMASYGGGARVGAMVNYVSRDGEVTVETETGERLSGREELSRLRDEWSEFFQNRNESRDLAGFSVEIEATEGMADAALHEHVRRVLSDGFGDRSYAYAVSRRVDGGIEASGVLVLRDKAGERLTGDAKAAEILQARYDAKGEGRASARFSFTGYGNGVDYGTARLRNLVEAHAGDVRDRDGRGIGNEKIAGDLVQQVWRHELHSRRGRDVMHVIMSARAGTDTAAFERAARDFLGEQFAGYRYAFAVHDPAHDPKDMADGGQRPHVHAHAIVVMRNEAGDRIVTTPQVFREWRAVMAEKAREHGIAMEMTDRREFASAAAYGRNHVRAVNLVGRTEHVGTSEAAQIRYDAKRAGLAIVSAAPRSIEYTEKASRIWAEIAANSNNSKVARFAEKAEKSIEMAISQAEFAAKNAGNHGTVVPFYAANLIRLAETVTEGMHMTEMNRSQFEEYEKNVEGAIWRTTRAFGPGERDDLNSVIAAARNHVQLTKQELELREQRDSLLESGKLFEIQREPGSDLAKSIDAGIKDVAETIEQGAKETVAEIADGLTDRMKRGFPGEIVNSYFTRDDTNGTTRVFADAKGSREVFQDTGEKLRAKTYDPNAVRLMIETAAHRGWSSIELAGSKDFRREAWLEGQAHGIAVRGYSPNELDWQEVARREQSYLRNEIRQGRDEPTMKSPQEASGEAKEAKPTDKPDARSAADTNTDYRGGVSGVIVEQGSKPYRDDPKNDPSPYVVLRENNADRTVWGVGLPDALYRAGAKDGDRITLREDGMETVVKPVIKEIDGQRVRTEQEVERRRWDVEVVEAKDRDQPVAKVETSSASQSNIELKADVREAEASRTDPPQQQVTRLEQLQREHAERQERDEQER